MFRFIKIVFLVALAAALIVIAVANRQPVTLSLLPKGILDEAITNGLTLPGVPLFAVVLVAIVFGILIGEAMEWSRERRYRREREEARRELAAAKHRIAELSRKHGEGDDALLRLPAA